MDGIHPVVFCRNPRLAAVVNIANLATAAYQDADLNEQFREVKKAQNCADELNRENKKYPPVLTNKADKV